MIRVGKTSDIDQILNITKACAKNMIDAGIYQWNDSYPNETAFKNDVKRNELYVLELDKQVIGCVVITTIMDKEYIPVKWLTPNSNNIYIHRLAICPELQGEGYAQQLMDFAEQYALGNDYTSIRLDTFSQNKRNQLFYELRGYKKLEHIYFPKQSTHPFHCYELIL